MHKSNVHDKLIIVDYCGSFHCRDAISDVMRQSAVKNAEIIKLLKECFWQVSDETKKKIMDLVGK